MRFTKKSDSAVNDDLSWYDAEYKAQNCVTNRLRRHDSIFSVESNYEYGSANDLNMWEGAILLTADCLGTGILGILGKRLKTRNLYLFVFLWCAA